MSEETLVEQVIAKVGQEIGPPLSVPVEKNLEEMVRFHGRSVIDDIANGYKRELAIMKRVYAGEDYHSVIQSLQQIV